MGWQEQQIVKLKEANKMLQDKRENGLKEIEALKEQIRTGRSQPVPKSHQNTSGVSLLGTTGSLSLSSSGGDASLFPIRRQAALQLVTSPGKMLLELKKSCESVYKDFLALIPFDEPQNKGLVEKMIKMEREINDLVMRAQELKETFYI